MMRIFRVINDANTIPSLGLVDPPQNLLNFLTFDAQPKIEQWKPFEVFLREGNVNNSNFYSLPSGIIVFDEKVLKCCQTIFEIAGEVLPIFVERAEPLYILNILDTINCLDYDNTIWDYYRDGTKGRILRYSFLKRRVANESSLFKIPESLRTDIFTFSGLKDPDSEFYSVYHKNGLRGLKFELIDEW